MAEPLAVYKLLRFSISLLVLVFFVAAATFALLFAVIASTISPYHSQPVPQTTFVQVGCKYRQTSQKDSESIATQNDIPMVTIFAAPTRPFQANSTLDPQYQALLSWLMLYPTPKIILLGSDPSFYQVSKRFPNKIFVEASIDFNMKGTPLFHTMLARAQQADTNVTVVLNGETLLMQDFMEALLKTDAKHSDWVLFGQHWDVEGDAFPAHFTSSSEQGTIEMQQRGSNEPLAWQKVVQSIQLQKRTHGYGPIDYWAWNNNEDAPLLTTGMPPFSMKRGSYEKWILEHMIMESTRAVVDASEAIASIKASHDHDDPDKEQYSWEAYINKYLSATRFNDSSTQKANCNKPAPWKLVPCDEPEVGNLCMVGGQSSFKDGSASWFSDTPVDDGAAQGETLSEHKQKADPLSPWRLGFQSWKNYAPGIPHTLEELLPQVADENKVVVMTGVTSNYKEMLLSFVCRARALGMRNVLIAAFDEALFEYVYTQGLAVYLENSAQDHQSLIGSDGLCVFASECFQQVSKLKSWSVLRVLRKGYTVLWSDIDIVWFENPLPELLAMGANTLPIQSDEPDEKMPENNIRGANSGFYLARAEESTLRAFKAIVGHAMGTQLTEQPSFYDVLCGEKGERRVGTQECRLGGGEGGGEELRVLFLSHERYPNGFVMRLWDEADPVQACRRRGCVILHNNFIAGKEMKLQRLLVSKGLWFWDVEHGMCIHPWNPLARASLPEYRRHLFKALNLTLPSPPPVPFVSS